MNIPGGERKTAMWVEAHEASHAVRRLLEKNGDLFAAAAERLRALAPRAVVTLARGSSDNAATYARYLIETKLGILTASAAPSVNSVYGARPDLSGTAFLAISQSGRSPDLVAGIKAAKASGALTLALTNDETSPLAAQADIRIGLCAGFEHSVAATKTYIATQAAIAALVARWGQDAEFAAATKALPELLETAWDQDWSGAVAGLCEAKDLYVIGRGIGFGAAQEVALKFKETCALHAEAFSSAEVRHGPMTLASDGFPVFVLSQDDETRPGVRDLVATLVGNRCKVFLAGFAAPGTVPLPTIEAHPALQPILFIQSFYRMAERLARRRGIDPDTPALLKKVTETV